MKSFFFLDGSLHSSSASTLKGLSHQRLPPKRKKKKKKNLRSSSAPVTNFESALPPSHYSELYKKNELRGGHVIMLGADEGSQGAARDALAAWPGSLQVGGGVSASNAASWLSAGASHVIVTSAVFRDGRLDEGALRELVRLVGRERLVLDLSCRRKKRRREEEESPSPRDSASADAAPDASGAASEVEDPYFVVTDRWQKYSDLTVDARTLEALAASCAEFLVHAVDVEGKSAGIDAELISVLGRHSPIPVTYAGGASTIADLERVAEAGRGRVDVTVGSALDIFGGRLPFEEVVAWSRREEEARRERRR